MTRRFASSSPSGLRRALNELREYRVGHLEAAIGEKNTAAFDRQQAIVDQRRGRSTEDAFEVAAEARVKIGERKSLAQAKIQEDVLTLRRGLVDCLRAGLSNRLIFNRHDISRRKFLVPPSPPARLRAGKTMRSGA